MSREYVTVEEGESQYKNLDFPIGEPVEAIYVQAKASVDKGNPYIEALPCYRDKKAIKEAYRRRLLDYDFSKVKDMTKREKLLQIKQLHGIRFPMTFHSTLEEEFYSLMIESYRARKPFTSKTDSFKLVTGEGEMESSRVLYGIQSEATSAGITLTGYSGCGKSSAIHMLVSNYPPYIVHRDENGGYFTQIPYLVVNCVAGSNFSALYSQIGAQIDVVLGNITPVYEDMINKTSGLGQKAAKVCSLIERLGIGVIIFDEIQYINFKHGLENSFDSLLTITNREKIGLVAVGTEEARDKMFESLRVARRLGCKINANAYCGNRQFFDWLVKQLFEYQWFDEFVEPTNEIVDALHEVTKGIVDQLISTYISIHLEYLKKPERPAITPDFIKEVAWKYYPGIQSILQNISVNTQDEELRKLRLLANLKMDDEIESLENQEEEAKRMINEKDTVSERTVQLKNIISMITAIYDYKPKQIEAAFSKVMQVKLNANKTEREITRLVLEVLEEQSEKAKKVTGKRKQKQEPVDHVPSFAFNDNERNSE